jgi:hypothetical protein
MTQVVAALHREGIIVATDSRATRWTAAGERETFTVPKIFPLGTHAFLVTAGIGLGLFLSERLAAFVRSRQLSAAEQILHLALSFLNRPFKEMLPHEKPSPQDLPERRLFFLLGGTPCRGPRYPYRLVLLAGEDMALPLEVHEIGHCLTIPRSLGLEVRLHHMCLDETPLEEMLTVAKGFLLQRAREEEGVGAPFYWGRLTFDGLSIGEWIA